MFLTVLAGVLTILGIGSISGGFTERAQAKKQLKVEGKESFIAKHKKIGKIMIFSGIALIIIGQSVGAYTMLGNTVKHDLLTYINTEIPAVNKYESTALDSYNSVIGTNYTDDQTLYIALTQTVIPSYSLLKSSLEDITLRLKTKEVRTLNERYIDGANEQYDAFLLLKTALEQGDSSIVQQADEKLNTGRKHIREWKIELDDLCKKNGVKIE